ncbi:Adhesion G-protein coupled receptor D1 [Trichoplax sp. H2]|nr:Adhesion G-protein coupled receptor D1 [Trichoplax sp. H2]|eukprot:RDD39919.1 Adhesion G-protein coupled receptor D1 [Trichoplax sp. H2]
MMANCHIIVLACIFFYKIVLFSNAEPVKAERDLDKLIFLEMENINDRKFSLGNVGKEFHIGFPRAINIKKICPPTITITSGLEPATVNVTNNAKIRSSTRYYKVPPNQSLSIELDIELAKPDVGITNRTVFIQSDRDISVSVYQCQLSYLALPKACNSNEYLVLTLPIDLLNPERSNLMIIASHGATKIQINFTKAISYHSPSYFDHPRLNIDLQPLQAFYVESFDDLTGTTILSQSPVTVFASNYFTGHKKQSKKNSYNIAMQLPGVQYWGRNYILPAVEANQGLDRYRIMAAHEQTTIFKQFNSHAWTLSKGAVLDLVKEISIATLVLCDKPCLVVYTGRFAIQDKAMIDPMMVIMPSFRQFLPHYSFSTGEFNPSYTYFVHVVLRQRYQGELIMDGKIIKDQTKSNFTLAPYKIISIKVDSGFHHIQTSVSDEVFGLTLFRVNGDSMQGCLGGIDFSSKSNQAYDLLTGHFCPPKEGSFQPNESKVTIRSSSNTSTNCLSVTFNAFSIISQELELSSLKVRKSVINWLFNIVEENSESLFAGDLAISAKLLSRINCESDVISLPLITKLIDIGSRLLHLQYTKDWHKIQQPTLSCGNEYDSVAVMTSLKRLAAKLNNDLNQTGPQLIDVTSQNIELQIQTIRYKDIEEDSDQDEDEHDDKKSNILEISTRQAHDIAHIWQHNHVQIILNTEALRENHATRIVTIYFNTLDAIMPLQLINPRNFSQASPVLNSEVIAAFFSTSLQSYDDFSLQLIFKNKFPNLTLNNSKISNRWCGTWLANSVNGTCGWSDSNCSIGSQSNSTHTVCFCKFIKAASFAAFYQESNMSQASQLIILIQPITLATYFGYSLSISGLVITAGIFLFSPRRPKLTKKSCIIKLNVIFGTLVVNVLAIMHPFANENKTMCILMAVGLHYSLIMLFIWIFHDSLDLFLKLFKDLESIIQCSWYFISAYMFPLFIVGFTFSITSAIFGVDNYVNFQLCWLTTDPPMYLAFIVPISFLILVKLILCTLTLRIKPSIKDGESSFNDIHIHLESIKRSARMSVIFLAVATMCWISFTIGIWTNSMIFRSSFAILNGVQGICLLYIYCFQLDHKCRWIRDRSTDTSCEEYGHTLELTRRSVINVAPYFDEST